MIPAGVLRSKPSEPTAMTKNAANPEPSQPPASRIRWQGQLEAVQCRTWVWRYKMDNRTHHHLGYNLFVQGTADGRAGRFSVAVSASQHLRLQFRIGDVFQGTAWPCRQARHDVADLSVVNGPLRRRKNDGTPLEQRFLRVKSFPGEKARKLGTRRKLRRVLCAVPLQSPAVLAPAFTSDHGARMPMPPQ